MAEDLIAHGAIVSLANKDGDTPLDKARGSLATRFHGNYAIPHVVNRYSHQFESNLLFV